MHSPAGQQCHIGSEVTLDIGRFTHLAGLERIGRTDHFMDGGIIPEIYDKFLFI